MQKNTVDLTGMRFGRLYIKEFAGYKNRRAVWLCRCDCGNEKIIIGKNILNGKSQSCGCLRIDQTVERFTKHGLRSQNNDQTEKLYGVWKSMKARCYNKNQTEYNRYGGRGITVCDEWREDYSAFREWSFSNGYKEGLTIDRIDNDGNYCPNNCRWITQTEQCRNKSTNVFLEYNGTVYILKDLADMVGVDRKKLKRRIDKGMTIEEAINDIKRGEGFGKVSRVY